MSSRNRKPWETASVINQSLLDFCQDNLSIQLDLVVEIDAPDGNVIYASNRNKYKGDYFYEARVIFPTISRTLGQWLSPELEFSTLTIELNNADGRFNHYLPAGADYAGWIGREIRVSLGLADNASSYIEIYRGTITDIGGFTRSTYSITFVSRDQFDKINVNFPNTALTSTVFPDIEDSYAGKIVPIIYGDWTTELDAEAVVPAFPVNGGKAEVQAGTEPLWLMISENALADFITSQVYLYRGSLMIQFNAADIFDVTVDKRMFKIRQGLCTPPGITEVEPPVGGDPAVLFKYEQGDQIFVQVKGKDLSGLSDNIVAQSRDILKSHGGLVDGDFHSNWDTYQSKATPSQSAIASIKSRVWIQEPKPVLQYVLSMLEQVRLEAFIDRTLKLKINSMQFEDWQPLPSYIVHNWDVVRGTFKPNLPQQNVFNRAQAVFSFIPSKGEEGRQTSLYRNSAAILQSGKEISKKIIFPNLYIKSQVVDQLVETLRLASAFTEFISTEITWRGLLLDLGDFVALDVNIGSTVFEKVPAMIREIGYNPEGLRLPLTLWCFQMCPFPGWVPGYSGIVGGYSAIISEET